MMEKFLKVFMHNPESNLYNALYRGDIDYLDDIDAMEAGKTYKYDKENFPVHFKERNLNSPGFSAVRNTPEGRKAIQKYIDQGKVKERNLKTYWDISRIAKLVEVLGKATDSPGVEDPEHVYLSEMVIPKENKDSEGINELLSEVGRFNR
jgi:hypothetical protein